MLFAVHGQRPFSGHDTRLQSHIIQNLVVNFEALGPRLLFQKCSTIITAAGCQCILSLLYGCKTSLAGQVLRFPLFADFYKLGFKLLRIQCRQCSAALNQIVALHFAPQFKLLLFKLFCKSFANLNLSDAGDDVIQRVDLIKCDHLVKPCLTVGFGGVVSAFVALPFF